MNIQSSPAENFFMINKMMDAYSKNDIKTLREILFATPEFFNHFDCRRHVETQILFFSRRRSKNLDTIETCINFLEIGISGNLERHLKIALLRGNLQWAELLLRNGARLEGPEWRNSPAEFAFATINIDICKEMLTLLFNYGLVVDFKKKFGQNILHSFVDYCIDDNDDDIVEIAKILLSNGISVNEVDYSGFSALLMAVSNNNIKLTSFFINEGADIHVRLSRMQNTILHEACENGNEKMISLILQTGVDVCAQNYRGNTPLSLLFPENENYDVCVKIMIKEFSKLCFENLPVSEKDMNSIKADTENQNYFNECEKELKQMASTKYHGSHTYYSLLMKKNIKVLANLTSNEEFLTTFNKTLDKLPHFKKDLEKILEKATHLKNEKSIVFSRLSSIFDDILPELVLKKIAENLEVNYLPLQ